MNKSISAILATAKNRLTNTLNVIISENELPSMLYEIVLQEMLLEIKQQKINELAVENTHLYSLLEQGRGEADEKQD